MSKSSRPEITDSIQISEKKPDHHYRTEIPNIIFEILTGDHLLVYCFLKRIAGDYGQCWMSLKNLSKKIGIGEVAIRRSLNNLSLPGVFCETALINIIERYKPDGSRDTNLIEIVDIWRMNGDYFRKGLNRTPPIKIDTTPPIKIDTTPLSKLTGKEDLTQEDLKQEEQQQHARDLKSESPDVKPHVVVVVVFDDVVSFSKKAKNGWSEEEIAFAWQAYQKSKGVVTDPIKYIAGIISKRRVSHSPVESNKTLALTTLQKYVYPTENLPVQETDRLIFRNMARNFYFELSFAAHGFYDQLMNAIDKIEATYIKAT